MNDGQSRVVAVLDAPNPQSIVIWWVNLAEGVSRGIDHLCGAWVLPVEKVDDIKAVVERCLWLPTPVGAQAMKRLRIKPQPILDCNATLTNVLEWRDEISAVFESERASSPRSRKLKDLDLPDIPPSIDLEDPPKAVGCSVEVASSLGVARWLTSIATSWRLLETSRLSRKYLKEQLGAERLPIPIALEK